MDSGAYSGGGVRQRCARWRGWQTRTIESRKHDDICGVGVPALNMVGEACVNHFSDMSV